MYGWPGGLEVGSVVQLGGGDVGVLLPGGFVRVGDGPLHRPSCAECGDGLDDMEFPNFLDSFEDSDGDVYYLCLRCIDFQADYDDADKETRSEMVFDGHARWRAQWILDEREARGLPRHASLLDEILGEGPGVLA